MKRLMGGDRAQQLSGLEVELPSGRERGGIARGAARVLVTKQIDGMHLKARCTRHLGQRAGTASDYQQTIYFGGRRSHGQL